MEGLADRQLAAVMFTDRSEAHAADPAAGWAAAQFDARVVAEFAPPFVKPMAAGVMAVFTAADAALHAATTLQQRATLADEISLPAIGVSAGEVTPDQGDIYGLPVVEAARLQAAATPGEVLAAEQAFLLAGRAAPPLRALELKGLGAALPTGAVAWDPPLSPAEALGVPKEFERSSRFVGRRAELAELQAAFERARSGSGTMVVVAGEPGMGKTSLLAELAWRIRGTAPVLYGRYDEFARTPYSALRSIAEHIVERDPRGLAALGAHPGELSRIAPRVRERFKHVPPPAQSDPETERRRLLDAVSSFFDTLGETAAVVVLDDVQWAGEESLTVIRQLATRLHELPLLVIVAVRSAEMDGDSLRSLRDRGASLIHISGLDEHEVAELTSSTSETQEAQALARRSNGNPWLLKELLSAGSADDRPESAAQVLLRRVERLGDDTADLLRSAAVMGLSFDPMVLAEAHGIEPDAMIDLVEAALAAEILVDLSDPQSLRYEFAHALTRDALYGDLSALRRALMHQKVGVALEARSAPVDDLARHFSQATSLGEAGRAVRYRYASAVEALEALADHRALEAFRAARELLDLLPEPDATLALDIEIGIGDALHRLGQAESLSTLAAAADTAEALGDGRRMGRALMCTYRGSFNNAFSVDEVIVGRLERALELLGEADLELRALLLARLTIELAWSRDQTRVRELSRQALDAAERTGDDVTIARVLSMRLWTLFDSIDERIQDTTRLLDLAGRGNDPMLRFEALDRAILTYERVGDGPRVRELMDQAAEVAAQLETPLMAWNHLRLVSRQAALEADREGRVAAAQAAYRHGKATDQPDAGLRIAGEMWWIDFDHGAIESQRKTMAEIWPGHAFAPRGTAVSFATRCLELGMLDEAREIYDAVRVEISNEDQDQVWLWTQCQLARVAAVLGTDEERERLSVSLAEHVDEVANMAFVTVGAVARYLGLLAAVRGDLDEAIGLFEQGCTLNEAVGAVNWLAHNHIDLAEALELRDAVGDRDRAGALRELARETARSHDLPLVEARAG